MTCQTKITGLPLYFKFLLCFFEKKRKTGLHCTWKIFQKSSRREKPCQMSSPGLFKKSLPEKYKTPPPLRHMNWAPHSMVSYCGIYMEKHVAWSCMYKFNPKRPFRIDHHALCLVCRILVLDAGQMKEYDSPQALLANKDSLFYSLARDAGLADWKPQPAALDTGIKAGKSPQCLLLYRRVPKHEHATIII